MGGGKVGEWYILHAGSPPWGPTDKCRHFRGQWWSSHLEAPTRPRSPWTSTSAWPSWAHYSLQPVKQVTTLYVTVLNKGQQHTKGAHIINNLKGANSNIYSTHFVYKFKYTLDTCCEQQVHCLCVCVWSVWLILTDLVLITKVVYPHLTRLPHGLVRAVHHQMAAEREATRPHGRLCAQLKQLYACSQTRHHQTHALIYYTDWYVHQHNSGA